LRLAIVSAKENAGFCTGIAFFSALTVDVTTFFAVEVVVPAADGFLCADRLENTFVEGVLDTTLVLVTVFAVVPTDGFSTPVEIGLFGGALPTPDPGVCIDVADATRFAACPFVASAPSDRFAPAIAGVVDFCGDSDLDLASSFFTSSVLEALVVSSLPLLFVLALPVTCCARTLISSSPFFANRIIALFSFVSSRTLAVNVEQRPSNYYDD